MLDRFILFGTTMVENGRIGHCVLQKAKDKHSFDKDCYQTFIG